MSKYNKKILKFRSYYITTYITSNCCFAQNELCCDRVKLDQFPTVV